MNLRLFNRKQKILLFGGSFDPIHNGHISILKTAINEIKPKKILLIPSFISPGKASINITNEQKLDMVKLATKDIPNLEIIDYELNRKKETFFIETLSYIKSHYQKNIDYFLLIGQDQLHNLRKWKEYEEVIRSMHRIYVYQRDHNSKQCDECQNLIKTYNNIRYLKKSDLINISSSRIREEFILENDLNAEVLKYINSNGLYAINRIKKYCTDKRVSHSLRVAYYAKELMDKHNPLMSQKAFVAGLYHDIAKNLESEKQIEIASNLGIKDYPSWKVLHPYIGSHFLSTKYLYKDKEILDAISRHTLPFLFFDSEPTLLDKILFIADKLEPNRTNEDVFNNMPIDYFRELAKIDIDKCFEELYKNIQEGKK